jgi:hypothetical protein
MGAIEPKTRNKGKRETVLFRMAASPGGPTALARTVATAGALTAATGVALFNWRGIELTHGLATLAVASSALLLNIRHVGSQLAARSLFGLVRMRTWGLLLLGAAHAAIVGVALAGSLRLPLVVQGIYGLSSAVALVALSPLLLLAAKRVASPEPESAGYRIAVPDPVTAAAAPLDADLDAEADVAAAAEAMPARRYSVG